MIYFIILGDILVGFSKYFSGLGDNEIYYTTKAFWSFIMAIPMSVFIFKREIHELKIASFLLFGSITLFIVVFIIQLFTVGGRGNPDTNYQDYWVI